MGHEFLGVEEVGSQVSGLKAGDLVITPFTGADNTCDFCRRACTAPAGTAAATASTAAKAKIPALTGGDGTDEVIECVGTSQTLETAFGVVIDGGVVNRLGVPRYRRPGRTDDAAAQHRGRRLPAMAGRDALKVLIRI